jgi:putative zinc finger protein
MSRCESFQEDLTLHASGDLSTSEALRLEAHLAACAACAREREALGRLVAALTAQPSREREVDWERFAVETAARARREAVPRIAPFRARRRTFLQPAFLLKAAGLFLAAGLAAVLVSRRPAPEPPLAGGQPAGQAVETEVSAEMQDRVERSLARQNTHTYLEQSRVVLMNVLDTPVRCSRNEVDISAERERSLELLRRKQLLRTDLDRPELARAASLCDQLEGILMEISTLKDCADLERIQDLRAAVQRNQLLVKIRVAEQELGGNVA